MLIWLARTKDTFCSWIYWFYDFQQYLCLKSSDFVKMDYRDKAYILPCCHNYKDRIFILVRMFCNLHGSAVQYIDFSIGVTSQQFVAFKFVKICIFRTHPSFSGFHTGHNFDQISRKCRGTFQKRERWNVDGRNVMQFQTLNFLSLRIRKRFTWKSDVCH